VGTVVADEEELTQDEILAMFKKRREERAAQAKGKAAEPAPSKPAPAVPSDDLALAAALAPPRAAPRPPPQAPQGPPVAPQAADAAEWPAAPAAPTQPTAPTPAPQARASASALAPASGPSALRPASSPGRSLTASGPVLKLSERLLEDAHISLRGSAVGRRVGLAVAMVGLLGLALERRTSLAAGADLYFRLLPGLPILLWCVVVVALGALLVLLFTFVPTSRRLAVRLAASQKEEWERIQGEMKAVRALGAVGVTLCVAGPLLVAAGYGAVAYGYARFALLGLGALLLAAGLVLGLRVAGRRSALQRLYVQTMVLARLESSGLGPGGGPDPRIGPVLKSLDALLGALPEAAVRQFLASPQSQDYLDLIEEASEDAHG
jgi:hypothetical protein